MDGKELLRAGHPTSARARTFACDGQTIIYALTYTRRCVSEDSWHNYPSAGETGAVRCGRGHSWRSTGAV